jgi:hypothetical protein
MSGEPEVVTLVKRLSNHLLQHRRASDTAEGIASWWIASIPPPNPDALDAALQWMVDCGVLAAVGAADGRVHYRCRRDIDDLELRLDALARDPHSLLAAGSERSRLS